MICSLASRLPKAVAPSIWVSGIPPPPSEYASSLDLNLGTFPGHSWWSTRSAATTSAPPGVGRGKSQLHCQLTSGFLDWNQGNPKTKLQAHMGTTSNSNSWTGDMCSIHWTVDTNFQRLLTWAITWARRPTVMMYAGSSCRPRHFGSLGAIKMLVAPQLMSTLTRCISPFPPLINTCWIIWDESGLDMPHKYWLDMWAIGLSNTTLYVKAIRCCCMLSFAALTVYIANLSKPNSASSNHSCQAKYLERPVSFQAVDCCMASDILIGVLGPCLELMSRPAAVGHLLISILCRSLPCGLEIGILSTCRSNVGFRKSLLRPILLAVCLTVVFHCLTCRVCLIPIGRICRRQWCRLPQTWMAGSVVCPLWMRSP